MRHETTDSDMYLQRRNSVFYFRRRIPKEIAVYLTKAEIAAFHHSLGTSSRPEAIKLRGGRISDTDAIIQEASNRSHSQSLGQEIPGPGRKERQAERLRSKSIKRSKTFSQIPEKELISWQNRWFAKSWQRIREEMLDVYLNWDEEGQQNVREDLSTDLLWLKEGRLRVSAAILLEAELAKIFAEEDCERPVSGYSNPLFLQLKNRIHAGLIHLRKKGLEILDGGYEIEPASSIVASATVSPKTAGISLGELIERFKAEPKRQMLSRSTQFDFEFAYRLLREELGNDRIVSEISREDIREITDLLKKLPGRSRLTFKDKTVRQMVELANLPLDQFSDPKTYNKKVSNISTLFRYAEIEEYISHNPARHFTIPQKEKRVNPGYSIEQLNGIFKGDIYLKFVEIPEARLQPMHELKPCFFWVPLIALFTGMRSNEILQISSNWGVWESEGIMALRTGSEVKNSNSDRVVPVHPALFKMGFGTYLKRVRDGGFKQLFPDAREACDGRLSTWFSKPFARYLCRIGIKSGRAETFHTFRHTFVTELRRAGVEADVRKMLTGHARNDDFDSYYGGEPIRRAAKNLKKAQYPGLDLTHLYLE